MGRVEPALEMYEWSRRGRVSVAGSFCWRYYALFHSYYRKLGFKNVARSFLVREVTLRQVNRIASTRFSILVEVLCCQTRPDFNPLRVNVR